MKKVILLAMLMPFTAFGQIVDNFESGNLNNWVQSTGDRWKADGITPLSGVFSLHHIFDNPDAGSDNIGMRLANLHPKEGITKWTFLLRHGYDPSSSNNWMIFLMSDSGPSDMSVSGTTSGYAIGVNITGTDDTLRLVKVKKDVLTTVVNCRVNWQTSIGINDAAKINIERSPDGTWTVSVLRLNGNSTETTSGSDSELFNTSWFGIIYRYSATRDRLLWVDNINIEGSFYEDNDAPLITGYNITGKNSIEVSFNEQPSAELLIPENFSLNAAENKTVMVRKINLLTFIIEFQGKFKNKLINNLIINKVCDNSDNCSLNLIIPFTPIWAETGDVVISEIMAHPVPEVSLPGREYLEVTNRTDFSFNLKNWKLKAEDQSYPVSRKILGAHEIMIFCLASDTSSFTKYGKVTGLKQFPILTDDGKMICLTDSSGTLIHGVEYSSLWYGDELKSSGGWSLEMIDTGFPFFDKGNWTASTSRKGGTPGTVNSVMNNNPDNFFYGMQNVFPEDSINITIRFSEPVPDFKEILRTGNIGGKSLIYLNPVDPLFRIFSAKVADPLQKGEIYQFDISGDVKDFAGNRITKTNYSFGLTETTKPGDILFNELLFNPLPGDPDYIELFNCSGKIIDGSRLQVVSVSDAVGDTSQLYPVLGEKRCILPASYFAITTDRKRILNRYISGDSLCLFEIGNMASMSDYKGHLILYNRELDKLDEVSYTEKMHYSLLSGYEGISLEKTSPCLSSWDAVNWHSAAESSGWGTPGAPNSIYSEIPAAFDQVVFSSSKITPDNDGYEDFLLISFNLNGNGNVISAMIFDEAGNYVKKIASNLLAGPEATLIWDGTVADGTLADTGIYIVFISLFDDTGKTGKWKKVCSVIRK